MVSQLQHFMQVSSSTGMLKENQLMCISLCVHSAQERTIMWLLRRSQEIQRSRSTLLHWCAGLGVTLLAALFLSWIGVITQIDSQLATLGFDADRLSLIASLL